MADDPKVTVRLSIDSQRRPFVAFDCKPGQGVEPWYDFSHEGPALERDAVVSPSVLEAFAKVVAEALDDPRIVSHLHRTQFFDPSAGC